MKKTDAENNRISLNAVRVFESVVRHNSLKKAASELCVSPSAISHQIKSFEESLGVQLFERKHNSISLTSHGNQFFQDIQPPLISIENAVSRLSQHANHLVLRVGISLAVRWLIPQLEDFKNKFPGIRVRLETTHESGFGLTAGVDIALSYRKINSDKTNGKLMFNESCQPLISPTLLAKYNPSGNIDYGEIPAVSSNSEDWDWRLWERAMGLEASIINIVDRFDTDDAAIHAAANGMGMVLTSDFMAEKELMNGYLVRMPGTKSMVLGSYWLISSLNSNAASRQFESWVFNKLGQIF